MKMDPIEYMSPFELTLLSFLIAVYLSEGRDAGYLNSLGNLIVAIGGLILAWAAQAQYRQSSNNNSDPCSSEK
jgi:hypothetical protein